MVTNTGKVLHTTTTDEHGRRLLKLVVTLTTNVGSDPYRWWRRTSDLTKGGVRFLGVVVCTRVHTPRFCGQPLSAGDAVFLRALTRPFRTSWLMVGVISSKNVVRRGGVSLQFICLWD